MSNSQNIEKLIASYMKKGELIKPVLGFKDNEHPNFFCEDCDAEWFGDVYPQYITKEQLEKIKKAKGINKTTYNNMKNFKTIQYRKIKEDKKKKRRKRRELNKQSKLLKNKRH
jgi:hypothetical protein